MFATFSTEPGGHLERYALFKFNENGVEHIPLTSELNLIYNEDGGCFENIIIKGSSTYHYWTTNWDVIQNGNIIPVYDFINMASLFPKVPLVKCMYDSIDWCNYRIREHKTMYTWICSKHQYTEEALTPIVRLPVSPKVTTSNEKLPTFVAEALIKAVKDSNAECSISMTPFKDCPNISVTNCYHCFDAESLDKWRERKSTCPMCKCEIKFITNI